ncbi:MAG: hypothetical protein EZS28_047439, partial [Streblomastix strix]
DNSACLTYPPGRGELDLLILSSKILGVGDGRNGQGSGMDSMTIEDEDPELAWALNESMQAYGGRQPNITITSPGSQSNKKKESKSGKLMEMDDLDADQGSSQKQKSNNQTEEEDYDEDDLMNQALAISLLEQSQAEQSRNNETKEKEGSNKIKQETDEEIALRLLKQIEEDDDEQIAQQQG